MAVLPSEESETKLPCWAAPLAPVPTSFPSWAHEPAPPPPPGPLRLYTHAAPCPLVSPGPPTMAMAVLPSVESETERPCCAAPLAPVPTSLGPSIQKRPGVRLNTHAAPCPLVSPG